MLLDRVVRCHRGSPKRRHISQVGGGQMPIRVGVMDGPRTANVVEQALTLQRLAFKSVIVISGIPGSGKSTLGRLLGEALNLPYLDKDEMLERLFEVQGVGDMAWRQELSRASDRELMASVRASDGVVVSSLWRRPGSPEASGTPVEWLAELDRPVVEVFCLCDAETAANRFKSRKRHPGHLDALRPYEQILGQLQRMAQAGPLGIGELIEVDTRAVPNIEDIAARIRAKVGEIDAALQGIGADRKSP